MFETALLDDARRLIEALQDRGWMLATAESCTGGLVAGLVSSIPGSSAALDRGFVTYSNQAKADLLGVSPDLIHSHGAVSAEVARAMAVGALARSHPGVAVAITGIAGPGGGSEQKPVGLVHFAVATTSGTRHHLERRYGDQGRQEIRLHAVREAVALALEAAISARPVAHKG